jgi:hypothetical protein
MVLTSNFNHNQISCCPSSGLTQTIVTLRSKNSESVFLAKSVAIYETYCMIYKSEKTTKKSGGMAESVDAADLKSVDLQQVVRVQVSLPPSCASYT